MIIEASKIEACFISRGQTVTEETTALYLLLPEMYYII